MALSGSQGFFGIATQGPSNAQMNSAPAEGLFDYIEAISAPFRPNDVSRTRRPTIGDDPLPRNAYKVGTSVAASVGLEATANIMGKLLYLTLGNADAPVAEGDAYKHRLRMNPANRYQVPYFAARRGVGAQLLEEALGCKVARNVLAFNAGDAVVSNVDLVGRVPGFMGSLPTAEGAVQTITFAETPDSGTFTLLTELGETAVITFSADAGILAANMATALNTLYGPGAVSVSGAGPFTITWAAHGYIAPLTVAQNDLEADGSSVVSPSLAMVAAGSAGIAYDTTPILTVVGSDTDLTIETASGVYTGADGGVISLGAQIEWVNMLTRADRYRIGSPFPIDYTLLDRVATVTLNMELDDPALYKKVYFAGGTVWDPSPWVGGFRVKATSAEKPFEDDAGDPMGYSMEVLANSLHFQAMLVVNEPQRVVEATLQAQLLKAPAGQEPLAIDIVTDRAVAFA